MLEELGLEFGHYPVNANILNDLEKVDNAIDHICLVSLIHEAKGIDAGPWLL